MCAALRLPLAAVARALGPAVQQGKEDAAVDELLAGAGVAALTLPFSLTAFSPRENLT